ncbi:MAG: deaminase [Bdellovibrio sp.]
MSSVADDHKWMQKALHWARKAATHGEVPVAALVVDAQGLVAGAVNTRERQQTPLGHAEMWALHKASQKKKNWRLSDCTLYVTLEPCLMCTGALHQARIGRVVYGASDPKGGALSRHPSSFAVTPHVLEKECMDVLQSFFRSRRDGKKEEREQKQFRDRTSVVVIHKNKILGFHAIDPTSQDPYFFLPGGSLEPGESPAEAARRECLEETGYTVRILEETAFERKYDFLWDGKIHSCRTVFFIGFLEEPLLPPQEVSDAPYHQGVAWLPLQKIPEVFSYNKDILWAVQKLRKKAVKKSALR